MKMLPVVFSAALLLAGCDHDDTSKPKESHDHNRAPKDKKEKHAESGKKAATPDVTGKWAGRWESGTHKGHGGGLKCDVTAAGKLEYAANFTAEFGRTKDYPIKLTGKPEDGKVVFGGKVDLGKEDGGVFTWTGHATADEFTGKYEGGGDTGTFKMARVK